ncbi:MAG: hypothetical protein FMNOHCHN_00553 [Ignavibacteriaceae bacterium]|nr:hypothetical protein [Ignavibacteriaceae bacterium]
MRGVWVLEHDLRMDRINHILPLRLSVFARVYGLRTRFKDEQDGQDYTTPPRRGEILITNSTNPSTKPQRGDIKNPHTYYNQITLQLSTFL